MRPPAQVVFLFDVDNTLLDNDTVQRELSAHLQREVGAASRDRYWEIFEELRGELGYADYLGALQRYRLEHQDDMQLLRVSLFLLDYPFRRRLYRHALAALARCSRGVRRSSFPTATWCSSRARCSVPDYGMRCRGEC